MTRFALSQLFAEHLELKSPTEPYEFSRFLELVEAVMAESGISRPARGMTQDARIVRTFLVMTQHSYRRLLDPPHEPPQELLLKAQASQSAGPKTTPNFAQSRCSAASVARRAQEIQKRVEPGKAILLLGDDDGLCGVLSEHYRVTVIDLDPRVVEWASETAADSFVCDVRKIPERLHNRFSAVVADPIRGLEAEWFLQSAQQALRPGGYYFWADQADWNFACEALKFQAEQSMTLEAHLPLWHQYPATVDLSSEDLSELGEEHRRFLKLGELISFWSDLYIWTA